MNVVDLPIDSISAPDWNPNELNERMRARLRQSIERFGFLVPLVVRRVREGRYETVGGAHRLEVLRDLGEESAACVVIDADDAEARLLSQCLNRLQGEDNLGLRADLIRKVLEDKPLSEHLSLLPDSAENLQALAGLGVEDLAASLRQWQAQQGARLKHLTFQLVPSQVEVVEEALTRVGVGANRTNPNKRGNALYALCLGYLKREPGATS